MSPAQNAAADCRLLSTRGSMRFPESFESIPHWRGQNGVSEEDGRRAFFIPVALRAIVKDEFLAKHLIVRGSTALWLQYGLPRIPHDIDLIATHYVTGKSPEIVKNRVVARLKTSLSHGCREEFDNPEWLKLMVASLKFEISPLRVACNKLLADIGRGESCECCDLDFLVAEKVIAFVTRFDLLPSRIKDVIDIAWAVKRYREVIDRRKVQLYADRRMQCESVSVVTTPAFVERVKPDIKERYHEILEGYYSPVPEFDECCDVVIRLVRELGYFK